MKRSESLSQFYNQELIPILKRLEGERKTVIIQLVFLLIGVLAIVGGGGVYFSNVTDNQIVYIALIPILLLVGTGFYMVFESIIKNSNFYKDYKNEIIFKIIRLIHPSLHYDKKHYISHAEYNNSHFFPKEPTEIYGDDHVSGEINGVKIEFSDLTARFKREIDRKTHKNDNQFKGLFFVAEAENPYPADLIIEPKKGDNGNAIILHTSDEDFNAQFQVRLPNNDFRKQAEEMLSREFLKEFVAFKKHLHNDLRLSFKYNKMYIAISHDKELFEPTLLSSIVKFDQIQQHFNDMLVPINIIEHFAAHLEAEVIEEDLREEAAS